MLRNFSHYNTDAALLELLARLPAEGDEVGSRAGRVVEFMHTGITITRPWQRELTLAARKANIAAQIAETMWILAGRNDVEFLSHYLPRARDFSDNGSTWRAGYGPRLRNWTGVDPYCPDHGDHETTYDRCSCENRSTDQLAEVVRLLRQDPLTRRAVMSIWDPAVDFADSKDIPCNNWLSFSNRLGKLDLHVAIRSNDLMWGWSGINAFEWSALLEIVAGLVGVEVGSIHYSTTSLHLYEQHWAKARKIVDANEDPAINGYADSPRFKLTGDIVEDTPVHELDELIERWFRIEYDIRTGSPLVQGYVDEFPEPMMRSWLRVLQWWWGNGDRSYLVGLEGTRLMQATIVGLQPSPPKDTPRTIISPDLPPGTVAFGDFSGERVDETPDGTVSEFYSEVAKLHAEKHEAYGDSWKRRGEMLGIMANIARKVDRLGGAETSDETSADTAIDLMVYLLKYRWWLAENEVGQGPVINSPQRFAGDLRTLSEVPELVDELLLMVESKYDPGVDYGTRSKIEQELRDMFDALEDLVVRSDPSRAYHVDVMIETAYPLARKLWTTAKLFDRNATRSWNPEAGQ